MRRNIRELGALLVHAPVLASTTSWRGLPFQHTQSLFLPGCLSMFGPDDYVIVVSIDFYKYL